MKCKLRVTVDKMLKTGIFFHKLNEVIHLLKKIMNELECTLLTEILLCDNFRKDLEQK